VRALLMALLVVIPSLVLPGTSSDAAQMAALVALVAAVVTFAEYASEYPTFLEFRNAPPFNRLRFLALFFCVLFASLILASGQQDPALPPTVLQSLARDAASLLDFPYSPVRLMSIAYADVPVWFDTQTAIDIASLLLFVTLIALLLFWIHARFIFWPIRKTAFNFWINLPLFDPTTGGDVVHRLQRDGRINVMLGFLLPFAIPAFAKLAADIIDPTMLTQTHTMIWTIAAWAFLPASMLMRGMAMLKIGDLIEEKRRKAYASTEAMRTA